MKEINLNIIGSIVVGLIASAFIGVSLAIIIRIVGLLAY